MSHLTSFKLNNAGIGRQAFATWYIRDLIIVWILVHLGEGTVISATVATCALVVIIVIIVAVCVVSSTYFYRCIIVGTGGGVLDSTSLETHNMDN